LPISLEFYAHWQAAIQGFDRVDGAGGEGERKEKEGWKKTRLGLRGVSTAFVVVGITCVVVREWSWGVVVVSLFLVRFVLCYIG
jgi:hypothetical protein